MWKTMFSEFGYVIFLLLVLPYIESASRQRLNEYISHYEPLSYDARATRLAHETHARLRRSHQHQHQHHQHRVPIEFDAHGRRFRLRLRREADAFADDLKVEGPRGTLHNVDTAHIYHGELIDEPGSTVFGSLSEGVFEGKIISPHHGAFYVEHARRYQPTIDAGNSSHLPHSVIYRDGDVDDPYAHRRHGHVGGCGITDDVVQWMERIQNSAVDDDIPPPPPPSPRPAHHRQHHRTPNSIIDDRPQFNSDDFAPHTKYTREANIGEPDNLDDPNPRRGPRRRRATRPKDDNRNTCSLFIQTDPLIWRHIREGFPDHRDYSKKAKVDEKTREEILSLIAHHVTAVNYIYRDTKFDGRIEHRNIKFEVQRIKIDDDSACNTNQYSGEINQFCLENIDVSNFLNLHSLGNHEDFCLAYVFTYRDFTGGTLGLAWVASASGASGGICEKYKTYTETIGGMYQSTKRSLNTGIITFVNYNSRVPPKVSQLTLAHEIGHNFGSPHDYPAECRPGGPAGNYIMFASATSGDRPNNSRFSSCSVGNISAVLDAVREGRKRNCFTASAGAFCGNKIVEAGEECDCGYDDDECNDKCCYPRSVSELDKLKNGSAVGCHRRYNTQCSPSQGPCCSGDTCRFVSGSRSHTCRSASECAKAATCDGYSARCPTASPLPDKTRCNNGTQLCIAGDCSGSICLAWNMTECFLSSSALIDGDGGAIAARSSALAGMDRRALCQLACQIGTDTATCRSTADFASSVGLPTGGISLRPGSPCDNFQGYCDVFLKCRAVDAEGPLARLKNLLLNKQTLMTVATWVTEHWWAVLLGGVALVCCMGAFVKCCAVHTPSSNPKQPPARRLSETLRRPMNTLRRMRHPHGRAPSSSAPAVAVPSAARSGRPSRSAGPSRPSHHAGRSQHHTPKASAPSAGRRSEGYAPASSSSGPVALELRTAAHKV